MVINWIQGDATKAEICIYIFIVLNDGTGCIGQEVVEHGGLISDRVARVAVSI
jgi:hypothetical protein